MLGVLELREASGVRRVHRRFAPRRVLKKVEPLDSKSDDLLQVTDLLTGRVNHRLGHPAGERKQQLRRKAEELGLISDRNIWVWKPKNEGP